MGCFAKKLTELVFPANTSHNIIINVKGYLMTSMVMIISTGSLEWL
ncbi:MAG TPA: hypothetical protein VIP70_02430 [Nitrososphaeraceae archaeon]